MTLITNNISGSSGNSSRIGVTGSVVFASAPAASFPDFPGADVVFFVSGTIGGKGGQERNTSVFGGDMHVSGNLTIGTSSVKITSNDVQFGSFSNRIELSGNNLVFFDGNNPTGKTLSGIATPGGSATNVQFNNGTGLGGKNAFTFDQNSDTLLLSGTAIVTGSALITGSLLINNTAPFFSEKLGLYDQVTLPAGAITRRSALILADYEAPLGGSTSNPAALGVLSQLVDTGGSANLTAGAFRAVSYAVNNNNTITGIRAEALLSPVGGNVGTVFRLRPLTAQVFYGSGSTQVHVDAVDTMNVVGGARGRTTDPTNPRTSRRHNGIAIGDMGSLATQESVALSIEPQSPSSVYSLGIQCLAPVTIGTTTLSKQSDMLHVYGTSRTQFAITGSDDVPTNLSEFFLTRTASAATPFTTTTAVHISSVHSSSADAHQVEGTLIEGIHSGGGKMQNVYGARIVASARPYDSGSIGDTSYLIGTTSGVTHGFLGTNYVDYAACISVASPQGRSANRKSNTATGLVVSNQGSEFTSSSIGIDVAFQTGSALSLGIRSLSPVVVGTTNVVGSEMLRVAGGSRLDGTVIITGSIASTSLTSTQLVVAGTDGLLSGTNLLTWEEAGAFGFPRFRIGTSTSQPSVLYVSGSSAGAETALIRARAGKGSATLLDLQDTSGNSKFKIDDLGSTGVVIRTLAGTNALYFDGDSSTARRINFFTNTGPDVGSTPANTIALNSRVTTVTNQLRASTRIEFGANYWNGSANIGITDSQIYTTVDNTTPTYRMILQNGSGQFNIKNDGNVGVNVNPTARFHVAGNASDGTITSLLVRHGVANGSSLPVVNFQNSAGSSLFFISGSGNVGIGTSSPSGRLHVSDGTFLLKNHAGYSGSEVVTTTGAVQTTDATTSTLFTSPTIADNSATWVEVRVAARDTGGTNRGMAVRRALVSRDSAGAATLVGSVSDEYTNMPAAWGGGVALTQATIDVTGNTFRVRVQGAAATINWVCTVNYQSVSGT